MVGSPSLLSGFASRYTIERELGRGGTAIVYLARDSHVERLVALKVLRHELSESIAADRFLREIRLNESLHHQHIAPILDSGEADGKLFFVLPYMEGGSLREVLERERQLSIDTVVHIARTIGEALDYAHRQGLIHRDVKPENILFSSGQACLADFGIARAIERAAGESTTETGLIRGTPAYMSPEQASGDRRYDGRSDQYSLACVLYEMLAGVPAFLGATPEATISMRFRHAPRELRVYRPSVPPALEQVLERAMALVPADRYPTIGGFSTAFQSAAGGSVFASAPVEVSTNRLPRRRYLLVGVAVATVVLASAAYVGNQIWSRNATLAGDTTRVVVFPFEANSSSEASGIAPHEMLHAAFRRWQGLTMVPLDQVLDALRSEAGAVSASPDQMKSVTRSLGARRYVVGRITRTPTGFALLADYRDAALGSLHAAQVDLPKESAQITKAYAALADSLVLRGASDGGPSDPNRSRNLFATQAFIRAMAARDEWDLARADSLLAVAVALEPTFTRGYMWEAQVRSWRRVDAAQWIAIAERALGDSTQLAPAERDMARGLVLLGTGDYPAACNVYRRLIKEDARSFAAWYGLGECNRNDRTVVPDARSPSGWRFQSNYQQAVDAYVRAFQLIPATYRGFRDAGYSRLRTLLFTSGRQLHAGYSRDQPRKEFLGFPLLVHDSITLVPWERESALAGRIQQAPSGAAITKLRALFDTITVRWAAAFPTSADAKEALALSLELRGEPAARDSIRSAERLATDSVQRLRLVATRLVLQIKFGIPDAVSELSDAVNAIDSLLKDSRHSNPATDSILAPLAALTGRCQRTGSMLHNIAEPSTVGDVRLTRDVVAEASRLKGYVAAGCAPAQLEQRLDEISRRIVLSPAQQSKRPVVEYFLLGEIVRLAAIVDSAWIARMVKVGSRTLAVSRDVSEGNIQRARLSLEAAARTHQTALPGETTPEVIVPEARLWLRMADTAAAIKSLEGAITTARYAPPLISSQVSDNAGRMGFLSQALALHAILSVESNRESARRTARAAVILLDKADAEMQPLVARLRKIAK